MGGLLLRESIEYGQTCLNWTLNKMESWSHGGSIQTSLTVVFHYLSEIEIWCDKREASLMGEI